MCGLSRVYLSTPTSSDQLVAALSHAHLVYSPSLPERWTNAASLKELLIRGTGYPVFHLQQCSDGEKCTFHQDDIYIDNLFQRVVHQAERPYISRDNRLANHHQHRNKTRQGGKRATNCDALPLEGRPTT